MSSFSFLTIYLEWIFLLPSADWKCCWVAMMGETSCRTHRIYRMVPMTLDLSLLAFFNLYSLIQYRLQCIHFSLLFNYSDFDGMIDLVSLLVFSGNYNRPTSAPIDYPLVSVKYIELANILTISKQSHLGMLPIEWVASNRILVLAQRFLRSPRGKHCNSLERNLWRKVVSTSKITILVKIIAFCRYFIRNSCRQYWYRGGEKPWNM